MPPPAGVSGLLWHTDTPIVISNSGAELPPIPLSRPAGQAVYVVISFTSATTETSGVFCLTTALSAGVGRGEFEFRENTALPEAVLDVYNGASDWRVGGFGVPALVGTRTWELWAGPTGGAITGPDIGTISNADMRAPGASAELFLGYANFYSTVGLRWAGTINRMAIYSAVPSSGDRALLTAWANGQAPAGTTVERGAPVASASTVAAARSIRRGRTAPVASASTVSGTRRITRRRAAPVASASSLTATPTPAAATGRIVDMNVKTLGFAVPRNDLARGGTAWMDAMVAAGAKTLRFDFYFDQIQPTQGGAYTWDSVDSLVTQARARGLHLLGILTGRRAGKTDELYDNAPDRTAFAQFSAAAVTRYAGVVDYWAIYNEPNLDKMSATNYVALLNAAGAAIRAARPQAFITGPNMGNNPEPSTGNWTNNADFLNAIFDGGADIYCDAIGFHPYTYPYWPDEAQSFTGWNQLKNVLRPIMVARGAGAKKIWLTEVGYPSGPTTGTGSSTWYTNAYQAEVLDLYLNEYKTAAMNYCGPMFWYEFQDKLTQVTTEDFFGLRATNGTAKVGLTNYAAQAATFGPLVEGPTGATVQRGAAVASGSTVAAGRRITRRPAAGVVSASTVAATDSITRRRGGAVASGSAVGASGAVIRGRSAAVASASTVAAADTAILRRGAAVASGSTITATGRPRRNRAAAVASAATVAASDTITRRRGAGVVAASTVGAEPAVIRRRGASVAAASSVAATAGTALTMQRDVDVVAASTVAAADTITRRRGAAVASGSTFTAARSIRRGRSAGVASASSVVATGGTGTLRQATAAVVAASTVAASESITRGRTGSIVAASTASASDSIIRRRAAAVVAGSTLTAASGTATAPKQASAAVVGASSLGAAPRRIVARTAPVVSTSTAAGTRRVTRGRAAPVASSATVAAGRTRRVVRAAPLVAASLLVALAQVRDARRRHAAPGDPPTGASHHQPPRGGTHQQPPPRGASHHQQARGARAQGVRP